MSRATAGRAIAAMVACCWWLCTPAEAAGNKLKKERNMFPGNPTQTSNPGIGFLEWVEGCELAAYPDPGSELGRVLRSRRLPMRDYTKLPTWRFLSGDPWTIGVGSTDPKVHPGDTITEEQCRIRLRHNLATAEEVVNRLVAVPLEQHQFDALVSFVFNVGEGTPQHPGFKQSTLLRCLNLRNYDAAGYEFGKWRKANGVVDAGLENRRLKESELFVKAAYRPSDT